MTEKLLWDYWNITGRSLRDHWEIPVRWMEKIDCYNAYWDLTLAMRWLGYDCKIYVKLLESLLWDEWSVKISFKIKDCSIVCNIAICMQASQHVIF